LKYGQNRSTICKVVNYKTYKDVCWRTAAPSQWLLRQ
jgi:hypothetical protein